MDSYFIPQGPSFLLPTLPIRHLFEPDSDTYCDMALRSPMMMSHDFSPSLSHYSSPMIRHEPPTFHIKRDRSGTMDSWASGSYNAPHAPPKVLRVTREEPATYPTSNHSVSFFVNAPPPVMRKRIALPMASATSVGSNSSFVDDDIPVVILGDVGRTKLKAAISELSKARPEIRDSVARIGKIRLASLHQLLRMARVCGLWDYALRLASEQQARKVDRRGVR